MRRLALAPMLLCLAANWVPLSREQVEAAAHTFITRCRAEHLVTVVAENPQTIVIRLLKPPAERTEGDLKALRCLGRQGSSVVDFRPVADHLLGIAPAR